MGKFRLLVSHGPESRPSRPVHVTGEPRGVRLRVGVPCGLLRSHLRFSVEHPPLGLDTPRSTKSAESPGGADDPVARDDDGNRVGRHHLPHSTCRSGRTGESGDLAISLRLSTRDPAHDLDHPLLKGCQGTGSKHLDLIEVDLVPLCILLDSPSEIGIPVSLVHLVSCSPESLINLQRRGLAKGQSRDPCRTPQDSEPADRGFEDRQREPRCPLRWEGTDRWGGNGRHGKIFFAKRSNPLEHPWTSPIDGRVAHSPARQHRGNSNSHDTAARHRKPCPWTDRTNWDKMRPTVR